VGPFPSVAEEERVLPQVCRVVHELRALVEPVAHHPNTEQAGGQLVEEVQVGPAGHMLAEEDLLGEDLVHTEAVVAQEDLAWMVPVVVAGHKQQVEAALRLDAQEVEEVRAWMVLVVEAGHRQQVVVVLPLVDGWEAQGLHAVASSHLVVLEHHRQEELVLVLRVQHLDSVQNS